MYFDEFLVSRQQEFSQESFVLQCENPEHLLLKMVIS